MRMLILSPYMQMHTTRMVSSNATLNLNKSKEVMLPQNKDFFGFSFEV